jgi:hypothetical protein
MLIHGVSPRNTTCFHNKIALADHITAPSTIGNVVAGIANLYVIYMLYFDFLRDIQLPSYRQLVWSLLHFPFHLAMNIFVQGSSQFVVWWKIMEILRGVQKKFENLIYVGDDDNFNPPSLTLWFADTINKTANDIYALWPPKYFTTWVDTDEAVKNLYDIPESWWAEDHPDDPTGDPVFDSMVGNLSALYNSIENSLFASFKINGLDDVKNTTLDGADFELAANNVNWGRYYLVVSCTTMFPRFFQMANSTPSHTVHIRLHNRRSHPDPHEPAPHRLAHQALDNLELRPRGAQLSLRHRLLPRLAHPAQRRARVRLPDLPLGFAHHPPVFLLCAGAQSPPAPAARVLQAGA